MHTVKNTTGSDTSNPTLNVLSTKINVAAWGVFLIWIGFVLLTELSGNIGLLGVGIIILGAELVQRIVHLEIEVFWIVVGIVFVFVGLLGLYQIELSLLPVMLIAGGTLMVLSIFSQHK